MPPPPSLPSSFLPSFNFPPIFPNKSFLPLWDFAHHFFCCAFQINFRKGQKANGDSPKSSSLFLGKGGEIMTFGTIRRSRSMDLYNGYQEKYLSRWSRENTPVDNVDRYCSNVRRSFTPVRDVAGYETIRNDRRSRSVDSYRSPLGIVTAPYHSNVNYYQENQPVRKYDIFQARTWSYPIYKYIYGRDQHYSRPSSYTRVYGIQPLYTPSVMAPEAKLMTERRSYSGYNYLAGEHSFNLSTKPWSQSNYRFLRVSHINTVPWYFHNSKSSNLRHYNSYRPPAYTSRLSTYWKSYF